MAIFKSNPNQKETSISAYHITVSFSDKLTLNTFASYQELHFSLHNVLLKVE